MTIDKAVNIFEQKLIADVNGSNLPPSVIRLVLNEVLASVKEIEANNIAKEDANEKEDEAKADSSSLVSNKNSK